MPDPDLTKIHSAAESCGRLALVMKEWGWGLEDHDRTMALLLSDQFAEIAEEIKGALHQDSPSRAKRALGWAYRVALPWTASAALSGAIGAGIGSQVVSAPPVVVEVAEETVLLCVEATALTDNWRVKLGEELEAAIELLDPRGTYAIQQRFGFNDGRPRDVATVGEELGNSPEETAEFLEVWQDQLGDTLGSRQRADALLAQGSSLLDALYEQRARIRRASPSDSP